MLRHNCKRLQQNLRMDMSCGELRVLALQDLQLNPIDDQGSLRSPLACADVIGSWDVSHGCSMGFAKAM